MLIKICDPSGNSKVRLSPNDSSTQAKVIQGDSVLTLSFTHHDHIDLDVDDYADFLGERFWLTEKYRPKQNSRKEWVYDIKLYGIESMIKRLLVINTVDDEENPVFTLTAPPREHVALVVKCINEGMGGISDWKVGQVDGTGNIVVDYFGKYCDEALKEIAGKVGAEWWVEGQTVNICKCEHGEPVALGYDKGLLSIDPGTADNVKFYTRLYPVGSSRNIDREKYGFTRLQLPGGQKYVEINADKYGRVDHFEQSAFEGIYPRRIGTVSSVRSEVKTGGDGNPFTIYYFADNSLPFDPNDYMIGGLVMRVSFQEGSELAGLGDEDSGTYYLEVNFNSSTKEFEIITIWPYDDGTQLPGGPLVPKAGDEYILWNLRMPDEYYALAEEEFLTAVNKYNADHNLDISVYKAPTDHVWIEDNNVELTIGRRVRLESDEYFPGIGFRDSRITKITRKVNLPSSMDIEISDALSRTSQQKISDSIADVRSYAKSIKESISLPDIIRTGDNTLPTDNNLFSARRVQNDFMRKDRSDRTPYALSVGEKLTAEGGVQFGPVFAEGITGFGGKVDDRGRAWLESLVLRGFLEVPFLSFNRTEISVGNDWNAPGGGTLEAVEPGRDTDGTPLRTGKATLRLEDGELGAVAAGDICMGIWHDTFNTGANSTEDSDDSMGNFRFSGFRTVYFRITEILEQGDNSAFAYELREGSLHPSAQMTFVSYGSFTREDRRTSRYSTRTYTRYLRGVDTWEFRAENVAAQFGDLSNLSVFGLDMTGYSVYLDNVYMKGTIQSVGLSRFWLESSAQQVVRHADGTVTPATLTAKGWRKDSTGAVSEHGTVSYLTATGASGTVPAAGLATRGLDFPVTLRLTGTGVDTGVSLTVSEARDGTDGTPGTYTENLLFGSADFSPLYTVFPPHTDGEWFTYYTDYVSMSQSEQLDGRPTVRVRKTDADTAQYVGIRQFVDVSGFGDGEAFTLGFRTLVKDASLFDDDAYAELNFYDEGMSRIRSFGHSIPAATNAGERTHVFSDTKPAGARHAEVSLFLIHNGEIWFGSPKLSKGAQEEYAWTPNPADLRGKDGEDGTSVGISSTAVRYQASASGTAAPTGTWLASAPSVPAGQYLWTRTTVSYTDGSSTVSYSVSRQGEDGESGTYTENLLKGTRGFSGSGWQNLSAWEADGTYGDLAVMKRTGAWQGIRQPFAAEAGDTFIFSAFVKADGGAPIYFYSNNGTATTTPDSLRIYPEPGGWKRFEYRFTATTAGTVVPRVEASADTGTLRVAGLKLERGFTQKSAWTPNSEDLRGGQGLDGAVMRITEWEAGKKYYDGRTETDGDPGGPRFLDIVTRTAADGMSRTIWQCVMTHTAAEADSPGSGGAAAYWQQFSSVTPIYTPLLLADNAKITFLNTQEIVVTVDGEVVGRFGGGETPLWVGGATAATAKFALAETGKVRFGKDGGQRVELDPSTNGMSIYDGEGRKTEFRGERVADMAGIFKAASLTVSGRVASGSISSDEQQTKSQRVATVNAATAGNLKVSCTLSLTSGHEYASASAEVYVTDSSGSRVWADSLASEGGTGPKSKAVAADIYLPAAGTYYVQASLRARKYDYYAPGSDLSQGPTQTYNSSAGWSGLAVSGEGTVYKAQYLSNGWAIGNGSGSYASVWEDASGKMCFAALCGGKGLMVSPDGARVNHGNGWGTVPRALVSGWVNWSGIASSTSYSWAWRSNGDGLVIGSPSRIEAGKVFIPLPSGMPDPSRLSVQVTGRYTPLETAIGDMSGTNVSVNGVNRGPGLTVLLSRGGTATDSGFMITISEI